MSFTVWVLFVALLLSGVGVGDSTFPATLEVDLVFPRNDTYAPGPLIPIVFAFQGSRYASLLFPYIRFALTSDTNVSREPIESFLDLSYANFSSSDPYYAWAYIAGMKGLEDRWRLAWSLSTTNCSTSSESISTNITSQIQDTKIIFTT